MKYILPLLLLTFFLSACSEHNDVVSGSLIIVDSLGWQDSEEYIFSASSVINIINNELYVLDMDTSVFKVYDVETLKFKRSFGRPGRGPGEFMYPSSFTFDASGNIVVCDFANSRIQWISRDGEFIKSQRFHPPGKVYCFDDTVYTSTAHFVPEYKLIKLTDTSIDTISNLESVCKAMELIDENRNLEIVKCADKMIAFPRNSVGEFYSFENKEIKTTVSGDKTVIEEYSKTSNAVIENNCFWIVERTFSNKPESNSDGELKTITRMKDEYNVNEFLRKYSSDGTLKEQYELPRNILTLEGEILAMNKSWVFITNYNGIIMKLEKQKICGD